MAQNKESIKHHPKSPHSHLACANCPDNSISSLNLLHSYRSSNNSEAVVSAAAIILKAAADSQNSRKSIGTLAAKSDTKRRSPPYNTEHTSSPVAPLFSRVYSHSPTTSSNMQAALALAMAKSSPPSTCPSSSSSGHQGEHGSSDFRSDQHSSLGAFFRTPPSTNFEPADSGGNNISDVRFTNSGSGTSLPFVPFTTSSTTSSDMSTSACLTNAMLLPASIVNVLGPQMQTNQYNQPQSAAYLATIGTNSGVAFPQQAPQVGHQRSGDVQQATPAFQSVTSGISSISPSDTESRYSASGRNGSGTLQEDSNNKREQRLLKNREAARECRRKKKEYVRCLERQVTILQSQNHQLIEELQRMKALYADVLLDHNGQSQSLQGTPSSLLNDPRLDGGGGGSGGGGGGGGANFANVVRNHRKLSPHSSPQHNIMDTGNGEKSYHRSSEGDGNSSLSRPMSSDLGFLQSPVPPAQQQQLLLLQELSALNSGASLNKGGDTNYPWTASLPSQTPKYSKEDPNHRAPISSPHIPPVKRALKRFSNEQHRLSEQHQQESLKPESSKIH